jgi:hypothetical protein
MNMFQAGLRVQVQCVDCNWVTSALLLIWCEERPRRTGALRHTARGNKMVDRYRCDSTSSLLSCRKSELLLLLQAIRWMPTTVMNITTMWLTQDSMLHFRLTKLTKIKSISHKLYPSNLIYDLYIFMSKATVIISWLSLPKTLQTN